MTDPQPGELVTVSMVGEILETGCTIEGYLWVRIPGHGPICVPKSWVSPANGGKR